ncbi:hypothetical protein KSP39_PZI003110 [Platanthera zijinensis]|uniref:Uncharacterized protein n=1 Tax=Platanthera zijinensis TaxID=2320716 RepID=A0AAP0BW06_9ASPA
MSKRAPTTRDAPLNPIGRTRYVKKTMDMLTNGIDLDLPEIPAPIWWCGNTTSRRYSPPMLKEDLLADGVLLEDLSIFARPAGRARCFRLPWVLTGFARSHPRRVYRFVFDVLGRPSAASTRAPLRKNL